MQRPSPTAPEDSEAEYRKIEAALLESARGRWFLAEHGRRARRLDSALLEDAIGRLQTSLRDPPALLGQLESELTALSARIIAMREALLAKPQASADGQTTADPVQPQSILKAAEDIHDVAWSLQANPFDPAGCEMIARNAGRLYVMSQMQAVESQRAISLAAALDEALKRLADMIETVLHERNVDQPLAAHAG